MDTMVIKSPFLTGIIGKIINKFIKKKVGCNVEINIRELAFNTTMDNNIIVSVNASTEISKETLMKIVGENN